MARRHDLFACGVADKFYMRKRIGIMRIINSRMGIINNLVRGNIFYLFVEIFLFLFVAVIIPIILIRFLFCLRHNTNFPKLLMNYYLWNITWVITCGLHVASQTRNSFVWD